MVRNPMHAAVVIALAASLALAGCKKKDEAVVVAPPVASEPTPMGMPAAAPAQVSVTSIDLGNAVGADNRVAAPMSTFGAADTIYTVVTTRGTASNIPLTVRWTYQDGQEVGTETRTLNGGPATTEFHASKPGGWPVGKYKAEVMLNGALAQSRDFEVR